MQRRTVQSSNLKSVGYDPASGHMEVEFQTGRLYRYSRVPSILHEGLVAARSPGQFLNDRILGKFQASEIDLKKENPNG